MTMILSSADILRILGGSEIVRLSARLKISDGKPVLSGAEGLFIYIDRFPKVDEFEATWSIYIESDGSEPDDIVLEELKRLLPGVKVKDGLLIEVTTTDFLSASTQVAPVVPVPAQSNPVPDDYEERFQALLEDVQDQMLLINSGQSGRDGSDGKDGSNGKDGRDILATETDLEDLLNVEEGLAKEKGQVLTWDGVKWTNLFIPQFSTPAAASADDGTSNGVHCPDPGIEEAPVDGNYYVRRMGQWIGLVQALQSLGVSTSKPADGGSFTTGQSEAISDIAFDGGNISNGQGAAISNEVLNGGLITGTDQ